MVNSVDFYLPKVVKFILPVTVAFSPLLQIAKSSIGELIRSKKVAASLQRVRSWFLVKRGFIEQDPFNTFDQIMNISERNNIKSAFNFITVHTAGTIDGIYSISHPWIKELIKKIHQRGHEIGLHGSYNSFRDPIQTKQEFELLLQICAGEGVTQSTWGGRLHYLRWEAPLTWQNWESAGLNYDSTLCYADCAGFRCGICYDFPVFNINTRQILNLREFPLIVMECSILDGFYMGLAYEEAWVVINKLKAKCKMFGGNFTLLWHNSRMIHENQLNLYKRAAEN